MNGDWLGEYPKCSSYCDLQPLYNAGFEVFEIGNSTVTKLSDRGISIHDDFYVVCSKGTKLPTSNSDFLSERLDCSTLKMSWEATIRCEEGEALPYPRFVLSAGLSLEPYVTNMVHEEASVVHHAPHSAHQLTGTGGYIAFEQRGHLAVGNTFSWYSFVRLSLISDFNVTLMSWDNNGKR